jgi:hypothetical protein
MAVPSDSSGTGPSGCAAIAARSNSQPGGGSPVPVISIRSRRGHLAAAAPPANHLLTVAAQMGVPAPRTESKIRATVTPTPVLQPTITIDPAAMPAGTELSVGDFQLSSGQYSGEQQADVVLVSTSSYTCSSTPPDPNALPDGYGPDDGIGLLYGGPGPAGS